MLIVGSHALAIHAKSRGFLFRTPGDLDFLSTRHEFDNFRQTYSPKIRNMRCDEKEEHWTCDADDFGHIEFHIAEKSPVVQMYLDWDWKMFKAHQSPEYDAYRLNVYGFNRFVAPVEVLYSLKRSHRFLARQWEKHVRDYHMLKQIVGGVDSIPEITKVKQAETKHTHKEPSLQKSKDDFFKDDVSNHTFEHDQIHEIMAHRERPMFEYIKIDATNVACSKDKWLALPEIDKRRCVLEEAYVIALERGVIPMLYEGKRVATNESCLQWALMRIGTTLTSGWFRDYSVENYPAIWDMRDKKYGQRFLKAVEEGRIKPL